MHFSCTRDDIIVPVICSLVLTVEMDGPVVQDEGPTAPEDIPESAIRSKVPLECLYMVSTKCLCLLFARSQSVTLHQTNKITAATRKQRCLHKYIYYEASFQKCRLSRTNSCSIFLSLTENSVVW